MEKFQTIYLLWFGCSSCKSENWGCRAFQSVAPTVSHSSTRLADSFKNQLNWLLLMLTVFRFIIFCIVLYFNFFFVLLLTEFKFSINCIVIIPTFLSFDYTAPCDYCVKTLSKITLLIAFLLNWWYYYQPQLLVTFL